MRLGVVQNSGSLDIAAEIRSRGVTLRELDARFGLPRGASSVAIAKPYHEAEAAISQFLERPAAALWPERYNADGTRKQPQPSENYRPRRRGLRAVRG
jgi:Ner family transcriptional regulator